MKNLLILISIFVPATALISGCAPTLLKTPEEAGVIVLEGKTTTTVLVAGNSTSSGTEKIIVSAKIINSKGQTFIGESIYRYVLFGDLPPGTYRVTRVNDTPFEPEELELEGTEGLEIRIDAGELKYVGVLQAKKIKIRLPTGYMSAKSVSSPFKLVYKPEDEKSAWERLADEYKKTAWGERMRKRAAEL
jgi:hypothetical protein